MRARRPPGNAQPYARQRSHEGTRGNGRTRTGGVILSGKTAEGATVGAFAGKFPNPTGRNQCTNSCSPPSWRSALAQPKNRHAHCEALSRRPAGSAGKARDETRRGERSAASEEDVARRSARGRARAAEEVRRRIKGGEGRRQGREGKKWPKFWSACNKPSRRAAERRTKTFQESLTPKAPRASARTSDLADALCCHRYRGAAEQPHCARRTTTQPGPYDAIFEISSKIPKWPIRASSSSSPLSFCA